MATPTSNSTPVSYVPYKRDNEVDALLAGMKWGGGLGAGVSLTFSFPSGEAYISDDYGVHEGAEWYDGWSSLSHDQRESVRDAVAAIAAVANITFTETRDDQYELGEIRLAITESRVEEGAAAWAYYPSTRPAGGDVWFSDSIFSGQAMPPLSARYYVLLHELGHSLGLKHPFSEEGSSGPVLSSGPNGTDSLFYSVMSYTSDPTGNGYFPDRYPSTLMLLDIQALQYLYGANRNHASGDTIYYFTDTEKYWETLWDGGGINTIDYTASYTGATIDLREGSWSSLGKPIEFRSNGVLQYTDERTVWIAYGTEIVAARGSKADDTIFGNELDNYLYGHSGDDTLYGFGGDDILVGGSGSNYLDGGDGYDTARFYGSALDYTYTLMDDRLLVKHLPSGDINTLVNIQALAFDDETLIVAALQAFNAAPVFDHRDPVFLTLGAHGDYLPVTGTLSASDPDGDKLTFLLLASHTETTGREQRLSDSLGTLILSTDTGAFAFTPHSQSSTLFAEGAVANFTVEVTDGKATASRVLTLGDFGRHAFTLHDPTEDGILWNSEIIPVSGAPISAEEAQLYRAYSGVLGRTPDDGGFDWWSGQIASGNHTLESMVESFLWSQEFLGLFPDATRPEAIGVEDFLLHMYKNVFGREPDAEGFAWWNGELESGSRDRVQVVIDMTQSNEFIGLTAMGTVDYLIG